MFPESVEVVTGGLDALRSNVAACCSVAEVIRTTLGPDGLDVMLLDENSGMILSNDGATILRHLHVTHPAAQLLVDLAETQDKNVGDATTTVTILAAELLRALLGLVESGVHCTIALQGLQRATDLVQQVAQEAAVELSEDNRGRLLKCVAQTCLNSKILSRFHQSCSDLAVKAALCSSKESMTGVHVVTVEGGSVGDSVLADGIVLRWNDHSVGKHTVGNHKIPNARILLANLALDTVQSRRWGGQARMKHFDEGVALSAHETDTMRARCQELLDSSEANVVLNMTPIFDVAAEFFTSKGVTFVENVGFEGMQVLSQALRIPVVSDVNVFASTELENGVTGSAVVEQVFIGSKSFLQVSGCPVPTCTVVLIAPGEELLLECERSLQDVLRVLFATMKSSKVIGGGGCLYLEAAQYLRKVSTPTDSLDSLVFAAYADALEAVPATLVRNCGYDASSWLVNARMCHSPSSGSEQGISCGLWMGLDATTGGMVNALKMGVVEPLQVFSSSVQSAAEVAEAILRIDTNATFQRRPEARQMGLV